MKLEIIPSKNPVKSEIVAVGVWSTGTDKKQTLKIDSNLKKDILSIKSVESFNAGLGKTREIVLSDSQRILLVGLGRSKELNEEKFRRTTARVFKSIKADQPASVEIDLKSFSSKFKEVKTFEILAESFSLADYSFDNHKSDKKESKLKKVEFRTVKLTKAQATKKLDRVLSITDSMNFTRDLVNEAPNVLHSENYANIIEKDVKTTLKGKGVKVKTLNKADIKKEKMNLFLSVNAGSHYEPRLVHLTYTPKRATSKTKHIALVGKGVTFDTGGYSLKPPGSMVGMKFDMGGSATVYGAFRAAVLLGSPYKITCILAITDNMIDAKGNVPDSVIKGRSGKTVEILNTDAEGRLCLADALDYTCDLKPNVIIDAATLTGACLVAFGKEVCAVLGNDDSLVKSLYKSASNVDEYIWQLPIIQEYRDQIKSDIADIKNIGAARMAGTAIGAVFLENFIKDDISWAHLDIAGVCDSQSHLPYCPSKGGSGLMVRTLADYLTR